MSKHTPGPWVVRQFPTGRGGRPVHWILDSIPDQGDKVVANAIAYTAGTNDDDEANARLIAAAPDLLAAAKRVVESATIVDGAGIAYADDFAMRALTDAIALATKGGE